MKILVTGGAGFIGSHVVDLLKENNEITVLDNLSTGKKDNIPNIPLIYKSIHRTSKEDIKNYHIIIHCAAQVSTFLSVDYPYEDFKSNCMGTFRLFEACRKWNKNALIIYTSSRSVLGEIPVSKIADELFPFNPSTFYNVHKIYGEYLCKIYSELYGMRFIILRPSNVYGPRQPYWVKGWYNFIAFWIKLALKNKPIPIYGTGKQIRDYTYIKDIAKAYLLAINNRDAIGNSFLLATQYGVSLTELAKLIIELSGSKSQIHYFPPRKGDIQRFVGSYKRAQEVLNWTPKVLLKEGLEKEIEWIKEKGGKDGSKT